jgi:cytochrome c oxidase assembly protein subunit 15
MGILPPLNQSEWDAVFQKYQASPEYQKINLGMSLAEFKTIYWFEFSHRILGRAIGVVFLLPLLYFLFKRKVDRSLLPKLLVMFVLGGLQGLLGWYMVKSGLVDNPHVSQYRLTAHLAAAFIIYAYMFWVALSLLSPKSDASYGNNFLPLKRFALIVTGLIGITVLSGGFVAGLKAGLVFNTFPLMGGRWIPEGIFAMEPLYKNFFSNIATVQFDHRVLAMLVLVVVGILWLTARRFELSGRTRVGFHLLLVVMLIQVVLGISTLLLHVPVALAATHQGGALALFTVALFLNHELRRDSAKVGA